MTKSEDHLRNSVKITVYRWAGKKWFLEIHGLHRMRSRFVAGPYAGCAKCTMANRAGSETVAESRLGVAASRRMARAGDPGGPEARSTGNDSDGGGVAGGCTPRV